MCIDCTHNTSRMLCNECADGFYRDVSKPLDDLNVCLRKSVVDQSLANNTHVKTPVPATSL